MRYLHCDVSQVNRTEWRGYVRELDYDFHAATQAKVEYEAYRVIEECEGLHSFSIIFNVV